MKPALLVLLCLAPLLRAAEPAPAAAANAVPASDEAPPPPRLFQIPPAPTASPAQQQVNDSLPKYDPTATKERGTTGTPSPDAIELPKIKVTPKPRPRLTPEIVITKKGLEQQAAPLDKLINSSGLLGGNSAAERAREEQRLKEKEKLKQDVATIARAVEVTDPAQAKALRDAAGKP